MKRALTLLVGILAFVWLMPAWANDTVYYYYTNTLHSAVVETNAQGAVVETTYYAPYGQVLNRSMRDGPGYTGHEEDPETGLNYMQQRYFDPQSGRFLSTDPMQTADDGGNFNRYWYANDNPYRFTDPDGRETGSTLQAIDRMTGGPPYITGGTSTGQMLSSVGDTLDTLNRNLAPLNAETDGGFGAAMTAASGAVRTLAKLAEVGEAAADAAKGASAAERAATLAGTMGKVTQTKVTIAVTETTEGTRVVSSSEGALRPATRAALTDGEIAAKGASGTHAEVNGVNAARQMGMTPTGTAASRPICPSCAQHMEQQGVKPLSPLKHEP